MRRERSQQIAQLRQRSRQNSGDPRGVLHVVSMPIGHPDDITVRALATLRQADLIASEDPVATQALLAHHHIHATLTSYGPGNLKEKVATLTYRLEQGAKIALVSDCGAPVISDPGYLLVQSAHAHGIRVLSVPGPSALTAAITVAGISSDAFFFEGRLAASTKVISRHVERLLELDQPTVIFVPAGSIKRVLEHLVHLAPRRIIILTCNLTRPEEVILRGVPGKVHRSVGETVAGDYTLIIKGKQRGKRRGDNIGGGTDQSRPSRRIRTR